MRKSFVSVHTIGGERQETRLSLLNGEPTPGSALISRPIIQSAEKTHGARLSSFVGSSVIRDPASACQKAFQSDLDLLFGKHTTHEPKHSRIGSLSARTSTKTHKKSILCGLIIGTMHHPIPLDAASHLLYIHTQSENRDRMINQWTVLSIRRTCRDFTIETKKNSCLSVLFCFVFAFNQPKTTGTFCLKWQASVKVFET